MRHRKKLNHLSRKSAHRKAMLKNMTISLIEHKRIKTTLAKAKALRIFAEPILNRAKDDTTHSRRMVFKALQNKNAVNILFREIAKEIKDRPGGYTRIIKIGNRLGDNAEICYIELVDYNKDYYTDKPSDGKKKRTRRGSGAKTQADETIETKMETVEEKPEETKGEEPKNEAEDTNRQENNETAEDDEKQD